MRKVRSVIALLKMVLNHIFFSYRLLKEKTGMIKKTFLAAAVASALSALPLTALPLGNPLDATWLREGVCWQGHGADACDPCMTWCDAWSVRVGFYGDYVFNRYLEGSQSSHDDNIRTTRIITNAGYVAFNIWDKFDIFGTVGGTKIHIETPGKAFNARSFLLNSDILSGYFSQTTELETETYISWSLGARGTLWECGCFGLGAEAQYFSTRPRLNYADFGGPFDVAYFNNDARACYTEYQVGLGATYRIPIAGCGTFVVPYAGVKWAHAKLKTDNYQLSLFRSIPAEGVATFSLADIYNLESHYSTGVAVGITLVGCQRWSFTAEGRFIDEYALHINSQLRF